MSCVTDGQRTHYKDWLKTYSFIDKDIHYHKYTFLYAIWYFYFCLLADPSIDQGQPDLCSSHFIFVFTHLSCTGDPNRELTQFTLALVTPLATSPSPHLKDRPRPLNWWCSLSDCLWEIADCWWDMRTSVLLANKNRETEINWPTLFKSQHSDEVTYWVDLSGSASQCHYCCPNTPPSGWQSLKIWCLIH